MTEDKVKQAYERQIQLINNKIDGLQSELNWHKKELEIREEQFKRYLKGGAGA